MEKYEFERDGQIDFYVTFLPRINPELSLDDIISDYNDGVLNGNLLEFKLNVQDLNAALFQCIKYLSTLRIKGKPVPANIIIVSLNTATAWLYKSEDYLKEIECVYTGASSKNNTGFAGMPPAGTYYYDVDSADAEQLISVLKENNFTKIHIDENCIVGWANSFYATVPGARKEDFVGDNTGKHNTIGEIRRPSVFAEYIYPYKSASNVRFNYLMDKLNDTFQKKDLGAFYTPTLYAQKAAELVRKAISRVPEGNDYVIIDRCAGTGNLEAALSDEERLHCIVSTYEYYEYKVLQELWGAKVRHIIPPVEKSETYSAGFVSGADALSREFIENKLIRDYVEDPNCTIILFENPPYVETTSAEHQKKKTGKKSSLWKKSYAVTEMKKNIKGRAKSTAVNDLGNVFIWSAFKYYVKKPEDSYIVFSPVKYWKAQYLIEKEFLEGFAFNRKHFHTNIEACVMCALWSGLDKSGIDEIMLEGYNIQNDELCKYPGKLPVRRIHFTYNGKYYDKRAFPDDSDDGILLKHNGSEAGTDVKLRISPMYNDNMIGYMVADSSGFDNPDYHACLLSAGIYNGNGFYLREDNYLEKLPMFAASRYIRYNAAWTERARIMKSADGWKRYTQDVQTGKLTQFLLKCLLFTCLEVQVHMRSFWGSDGRFYANKLCLDSTNGTTIALRDLKNLQMNTEEKALMHQWDVILQEAKKCPEYDNQLTYGAYQIELEIDTKYKDEETGKDVWNHVELHSAMESLKNMRRNYYNTEIVPTLFEYEFLK